MGKTGCKQSYPQAIMDINFIKALILLVFEGFHMKVKILTFFYSHIFIDL